MGKENKDILLEKIRTGEEITVKQQIKLAILLSVPAILAQLSSVMMQYIDASMVGRLGANPSASIGLVSTSSWLLMGFCMGAASGFSVQVAHLIGSNDFKSARSVVRQGLFSILIFSTILSILGMSISSGLPRWIGGNQEIIKDASSYFFIFSAFLPTMAIGFSGGAILQASGNMKVPSILYAVMCVLDVFFNYIFIFKMNMGVSGAALGTGISEFIIMLAMLWFLFFKSDGLKISEEKGTFIPTSKCLKNAFGITGPMWLQNIVMRGAHLISTIIIAPLGAISIAANAFAITAESFCYMPGFGIEDAATALTGQSLGANRKDLAKRFAKITIWMAVGVMTFLAVFMYTFAPQLMDMLSNDAGVIALGAEVLRIEAFAESLFAVALVGFGICAGAGDTLIPTILNFCSMWFVRIGLALILTPKLGLKGYWIAMCVELNIRGLLFLWRIKGNKWMNKNLINKVKT